MSPLNQRTYSASNKELREIEPVESQATKSLPQSKTSLSFSANVEFQEIPHINELSEKEIEATWYTRKECKAIKRDVVQLVDSMEKNAAEKDACTRGVEHLVSEAAIQRKKNRRDAFLIVWYAQENQWEDGSTDHETISMLYQAESLKSREAARKLGMQDEKEAKIILLAAEDFRSEPEQ